MRNSSAPRPETLQKTNLVYEYTCKYGECEHLNSSYIGLTTTTLSRRLTMHLQSGAIKQHTRWDHNVDLTREMLVRNTRIIDLENDYNRLQILEALYIREKDPIINRQNTGIVRVLKLYA